MHFVHLCRGCCTQSHLSIFFCASKETQRCSIKLAVLVRSSGHRLYFRTLTFMSSDFSHGEKKRLATNATKTRSGNICNRTSRLTDGLPITRSTFQVLFSLTLNINRNLITPQDLSWLLCSSSHVHCSLTQMSNQKIINVCKTEWRERFCVFTVCLWCRQSNKLVSWRPFKPTRV